MPCWELGSAQRQSCSFYFLMPLTARRFVVERNESLCSCFSESARRVVTVPTWITGNIKGISCSNPRLCYLLGFFLFLMTQGWPSSQEHFGSLRGSDAPAVGVCWEEGWVVRTSREGTVHLTVLWHTGQNATDLAQACLAPCVLVPPLDLQPHSTVGCCFKKLLHSNNKEQSVAFVPITALMCLYFIFVFILDACALAHFVAHSSCYI